MDNAIASTRRFVLSDPKLNDFKKVFFILS